MTKKRQAKNNSKALDKILSKQELQIKREYETALKRIRENLAALYEATDGNFVDAVKYNRLAKLEVIIGKEIVKLSGKVAKNIIKDVEFTYHASRLREMYTIEKDLGFATDFAIMDKKAVREAVKNPYDRIGIVKRMDKHGAHMADQIRQEIAQGLIQGKSFAQTSRQLRDRLEIGAGQARTIVRTETHRARGIARNEIQVEAVEMGIHMKKMWVATIDDATRDAHGLLDGVTIEVDEDFVSETGGQGPGPGEMNTPEDDINCRCTSISVIEGFEPSVRRVRGEGIVKFETYSDWIKTRGLPERAA